VPEVDVGAFLLPVDLVVVEGPRLVVHLEYLADLGEYGGEPLGDGLLVVLYIML
jgi:hypothetical protein